MNKLTGLYDVMNAIAQRARTCEAAMAQAEAELNAMRKLVGYVRIEIEKRRQRLRELEEHDV